MLTQLTISNFAIIDEIEINLNSGLTAFTGETGAGKSIIIDALEFLLGARANADLIKTGQPKAKVEGVFIIEPFNLATLEKWFKENEFELDSNQIIISRELTPNGSKARINGEIVNSSHLAFLKNVLIDIHGQSSHIELLKLEKQMEILDGLGDTSHSKLLNIYKSEFALYVDLKNKLNKIIENSEEITKKVDFLQHQIKEIKEANIKDINEDKDLQNKRELLVNKKELLENAGLINELINGEIQSNLLKVLTEIKRLVVSSSNHDKDFNPYIDSIESMIDQAKDLSSFASNYVESFDGSTDNLKEIEDRLDVFYKLKKKHGGSLEKVLETLYSMEKELNELSYSSSSKEELEKTFNRKEKEITDLASNLTKSREKITQDFVNKVNQELLTLGFKGKTGKLPLLVVEFTPCELNQNGKEQIQFLFTSNPDEPPKPLLKVASGGELSRIMLAIKSITGSEAHGNKGVKTMVFDEIDSGISGEIASSVAKKLYKISKRSQVICITHQPIIAAMADKHFEIRKNLVDNTTKVSVVNIPESNRQDALATLLTPENKRTSGITEDAKKYAKSLLENANKQKQSQPLCHTHESGYP